MKYELNYGCDVITLPGKVLSEKLAHCKEIELKLLIALAMNSALLSDFDSGADELTQAFGCERSELDAALSFWRGAGVLLTSKEATSVKNPKNRRKNNAPVYSGEELARIVEDEQLNSIIDELQSILGRVFNPTEINTVVSLMRYLNVDSVYLMLLFNYCSEIGKNSMRYIETTAYSLYDDGITDTESLDNYIREKTELNSFFGQVRSIIGIGGRALSASEKAMIEKWFEEYGYTPEIIQKAYDITVDKTGKYAPRYLDKILTNWHISGLNTIEAIKEYLESEKNNPSSPPTGSFETDDFFRAALQNSYDSKIDSKE